MAKVKYKLIKNFFSKEELNVYQKYCFLKLQNNKYIKDDGKADPLHNSPAWYNDALMTSILDTKLPVVEKESNLKLFPTYAYWRYYVFGGKLRKHYDRPSCEVSVSVCVKKYDNWPIVVEGSFFELEEGDAVLYDGCEQQHWRPGKYKGEGMAQVFLHYVDKNGSNAKHAYDTINRMRDKK